MRVVSGSGGLGVGVGLGLGMINKCILLRTVCVRAFVSNQT